MPVHTSHGKKVILADDKYEDKYWSGVSDLIGKEIGDYEVRNPADVQRLLKLGFQYFCGEFDRIIDFHKQASFYIFVNALHEDSIELYQLQLRKIPLGINESEFASMRRILKIIIEQGCKLSLIGCQNFFAEIRANFSNYIDSIEELLYIGQSAYMFSEYIATSFLFPTSKGLKIEDGILYVLTYQPYPNLLEFVQREIPKHDSHVVVSDSIEGFKTLLADKYKVSYYNLSAFVEEQLKQPQFKYGLIQIENLITDLNKNFGYDKDFLFEFYKGLTLSSTNAMTTEDCIIRNQDINRYIYKPIVKLTIDGKYYYMLRLQKWQESMITLTTNAFPFGIFPTEWKKFDEINRFVITLDNTHDKILENPISEILTENKFYFDTSVESFKNSTKSNVNISKEVGDIDVLFLDIENKLIYICELKHNRSRFDINNWRRDYVNFKSKYESQLKRKVNWAELNKKVIEEHFVEHYNGNFSEELDDFVIRGIFIINAPTYYMFNGLFRTLTIKDFENLIARKYIDVTFKFTSKDSGEEFIIQYPYFDNAEKAFFKK